MKIRQYENKDIVRGDENIDESKQKKEERKGKSELLKQF